MRRILHIDMDAFFASVELRNHPELIGKPLVIGGSGDPTKRGVVSTASYEARRFGIHSAMPLITAYRLCPEAVFLPVAYREYSRVSEQVKLILHGFSPIMEDGGIDEAYLDITLVEKSSETIARKMKHRIRSSLGLTCSVGIAPNKLLAKISSDLQKPDGITILAAEDIPSRIWPLSARKLPGVGPRTEEHLDRMSIGTIGEIASTPREVLVREFGRSQGNYLYEASRGVDERQLVTQWIPKSSSRETTFASDISDRQILMQTLLDLTNETIEEIRKGGFKIRTVTVKMRFSDFQTHTRGKTLKEATNEPWIIRDTTLSCLARFEFKKQVRLIGVRLGGLRSSSEHTGTALPVQLRF
jgi:DNA polymerase-4